MSDRTPDVSSLSRGSFRVSSDEPAVHHPQLRAWVELATAQPVPRVTIDAATVGQAWRRRRAVERRRAALTIAAALTLAVGMSWAWPRAFGPREVTPLAGGLAVQLRQEVPSIAGSFTPPASLGLSMPAVAVVEGLGRGLSVRTPHIHAVEVLAPDAIAVGAGVFHIEVAADASLLRVRVQERWLRLEPGAAVELTVPATASGATVARRAGQFTWESGEGRSRVDRAEPSATALARRADQQMKGGQRAAAIETLERLVVHHPRSPAARTGLLDLARLRRQAGQTDGARCAYALYLERWPTSTLRREIQGELDRLGPGRSCRGIQPSRP